MTSGSHKIDVFIISGFVVYHCYGTIDFSKIAIITNFSLLKKEIRAEMQAWILISIDFFFLGLLLNFRCD